MKLRFVTLLYALSRRARAHVMVPSTKDSSTSTSTGTTSCREYKEIERLALAMSRKVPGSNKSSKAWRHWSRLAIQAIRTDLIRNLPHPPVNDNTSKTLQFQLGEAADVGMMPSFFQDAGARSGYAVDFFCRAQMLADLIMTLLSRFNSTCTLGGEDRNSSPISKAMDELTSSSFNSKEVCHVTSIGGGPGYDFVAAALVVSFRNSQGTSTTTTTGEDEVAARKRSNNKMSIHATILDYEEGWHDLVDTMSQATRSALHFDKGANHIVNFGGKCDITKPLFMHPSNSALLRSQNNGDNKEMSSTSSKRLVDTTDIWTIQYCVAENAKELEHSNYIFFRELFEQAKFGAIFIITETTHRLWPEFVDIALPLGYEVTVSRTRKNFGGGYQLVLRKKKVSAAITAVVQSAEQLALLNSFKMDGEMHQRKIDNGCRRQVKKVRGAK